MQSTGINLVEIALAYAARGWSVIPLQPEGKKPLLDSWKPYQLIAASPEEIKTWWKQWPRANIGIVTGKVSNLLVIDVDGELGLQSALTLNLPTTLTAISGRLPLGSGRHLYYQFAEGVRNDQDAKIGEKVDIRGEGGYVVAPCSLHESGNHYTFVGGFQRFRDHLSPFPQNVLDLLRAKRKEDGWEEIKCSEPWVTTLLQGVGEGQRHSAAVRLSGYFSSKGMPIDVTKTLLLDWNTRCTPPYPNEKVIKTVEDIYKRYPSGTKDEIKPNNVPAVSNARQQVSITSAKDAFTSFKAALEERKKFKGVELSTGFPVLDGHTSGLARANLAVVGAWPGVGKTAWLLGVVKHLAESGHKVAYFPTEMSKNEVLRVLVSNGLSLPFDRVFKGEIDTDEMSRIERYLTGELMKNLEICETDRPSLKDIQNTVRQLKPDVVMLDYVQHCDVGSSQREGIQELIYGLKSLSKEVNAATLVSSQFRRPYKNDEGQPCPPTMFDFAECGQIEREVSFALLMSPTRERFEEDLTYPVHFSLAKNRFGKVAEFELSFSQSYVRFTQ